MMDFLGAYAAVIEILPIVPDIPDIPPVPDIPDDWENPMNPETWGNLPDNISSEEALQALDCV